MLILSWGNPYGVESYQATVYRSRTGTDPFAIVRLDTPLGVCADLETDDLNEFYRIDYQTKQGSVVHTVSDEDVRRYAATPTLTEILFTQRTAAGAPAVGRQVTVTDERGTGAIIQQMLLNRRGEGSLFLERGSRVRIALDDARYAFDAIIPNQRCMSFAELTSSFGSWVQAERRGWF